MPIVSSTYTVEHTQRDGTRWVREIHVDHLGEQHVWDYRSLPGADRDAILAEHAALLDQRLAEQEIDEVLNG